MSKIEINIYRSAGAWYGARWVGGEYDGCDAIDVADDATEAEARAAAEAMPLASGAARLVRRVADA